MYITKKIVAIIPARAGSKRLPGKNIKSFAGKPLLAHSIEQGLNSKYVDAVYVSSENESICRIAKRFGARVLDRPHHLATDTAKLSDVLKHAAGCIKDFDVMVLLQPTSPLRKASHIDEAVEVFMENKADTVISVTKLKTSLNWIMEIENQRLKFVFDNNFSDIRSQDQKEYFKANGAIFVHSRETVLNANLYTMGKRAYPYIMHMRYALDIDTVEDFEAAQALKNEKAKNNLET